jgi:F0F1-type ATP synthase assembly protein I
MARWDGPGVRYAGLGVELAAAIGGLALVGHWVDRHFGWAPWGLLTGSLIGLVGGMYNLVRTALAASRSGSPPGDRDGR